MNKRLRLILVGLFFAVMFSYAGVGTYLNFTRGSMTVAPVRGWAVTPRDGRMFISQVFKGGPASAAPLSVGDELVALNGQPVESLAQMLRLLERLKPGSPYAITIARDGREVSLTLITPPTPLSLWALYVVYALTSLIFLSAGLVLFLLKPFNKQALLLALFFGRSGIVNWLPFDLTWWLLVPLVVGNTIIAFSVPVFLQCTLNFPERSPLIRRFPRLEWYIYLPSLLFLVPLSVALTVLSQKAPERMFAPPFPLLNNITGTLVLLYVLGGLLSFIIGYRHLNQVGRRKVRVLLAALLVAAVPFVTITILLLINGINSPTNRLDFSATQLGWLSVIRSATFWVIPLAWAYAILRHQVIPVSLLIRRSVQYLLAKNALRVIIALPVIGLALTIISNPDRTLSEILFRNSIYFYLLLSASAAVILISRQRLSNWIDRKFFREAYNQEKILRELIEDVKRLDSIPEMSKRVTEQVNRALHPEQIYLFYREENSRELSLSYTSGGDSQKLRIPEEFQLLRFMEMQGGAQDFPFPQKNNLPSSEKEWLAQLGTQLIVPMTGTDNRLAGLFLLGLKKSEVPYTASDRELLETLAGQIALVYENVRLKERVDRDRRIKHEVLARIEGRRINLLKECPRCGACYDAAVQVCPKDHDELALSLPVERIIEGRYRLDRLIGKGGMGAVYEAADLRLNRRVAVKILSGSMFGNSEALRRFEREAQTSARLNHQHIITIYDYGVLNTEGAYLVMELVEGETLGRVLKREGHLSPAIAARLLDQVLAAIEAAHGAGIIHRDLKPDNIFITHREHGQHVIKVLDFGLAKIMQPDGADSNSPAAVSMTTPGAVMGTFGYMSPEQLAGGQVDERSDLFSIGVIAVEALTGRRPFSGKTYHELLTSILHKPFHLESNRPEVSALDGVLQRCLAKDPLNRFSSAMEMRREVIPAIRRCSVIAYSTAATLDADTAILKKKGSSTRYPV